MSNNKIRNFVSIFIYSLSVLIIFISCGPVPFFRTGAPLIDANVHWKSAEGSRSVGTSPARSVRGVGASPQFPLGTQFVEDYYASLGTRVMTLTPEKFQLVIHDIALLSSEPGVEAMRIMGLNATPFGAEPEEQDEWRANLLESDFYADFTSPLSITPNIRIKSAMYDSMTIEVFPSNTTFSYSKEFGGPVEWSYDVKNDITVEIPGYGALPTIGEDGINLGSDKFRFTFKELQPINWPSGNPISFFILSAGQGIGEILLPGYDGVPAMYEPVSYTTSADPEFRMLMTQNPGIIAPFSGIDLKGASSANFQLSLDLTDIIEVYDPNGTPDPSDDVVILAKDFWTRFTLTCN